MLSLSSRSTSGLVVAVTVLLWLGATGCRDAAAPSSPATALAPLDPALLPAPAPLTLPAPLRPDAGDAPAVRLAVPPAVAATQPWAHALRVTGRLRHHGASLPQSESDFDVQMRLTYRASASENGGPALRATATDVQVAFTPALPAQAAAARERLEGATFPAPGALPGDVGTPAETGGGGDAPTPAMVGDALALIRLSLPATPVAAGARWTVTHTAPPLALLHHGLQGEVVSEYTYLGAAQAEGDAGPNDVGVIDVASTHTFHGALPAATAVMGAGRAHGRVWFDHVAGRVVRAEAHAVVRTQLRPDGVPDAPVLTQDHVVTVTLSPATATVTATEATP